MPPVRHAQLKDGTRILIRPISPEDRETLAAGFERLSPESRYRRFFTPIAQLGKRELDYLTYVDHSHHEALVALEESTGEGIAVARFVRLDDGAAEPAIVVADDWQGRGVAARLLAALVQRAREEGVERFVAPVLADNAASIAVFERLGETTVEQEGHEVVLTIDLTEPAAARSVLADVLRAVASGLLTPAHVFWQLAWRTPAETDGFGDVLVVAADDSREGEFAVECAAELAPALGSEVHLVAAYRPLLDDREHVENHLQGVRDALRSRGLEAVMHLQRGDPALSVLYVARREAAGLIVVGSAPGDDQAIAARRAWDAVAHHAQCTVLIARRAAGSVAS